MLQKYQFKSMVFLLIKIEALIKIYYFTLPTLPLLSSMMMMMMMMMMMVMTAAVAAAAAAADDDDDDEALLLPVAPSERGRCPPGTRCRPMDSTAYST